MTGNLVFKMMPFLLIVTTNYEVSHCLLIPLQPTMAELKNVGQTI